MKILKTGNQNTDRKIRISEGVKDRFSETEREKLVKEFVKRFKRTGQRFTEKHIGGGDVIYCNVTDKLIQILFESEW